jgi:phage terminase small subunit
MAALKDPQRDAFCLAVARGEPIAKAFSGAWPARNPSSVPTLASQLMRRPEIKMRIAEIRNAITVRHVRHTADDVLQEMFKIGMANMDDFIETVRDENGRVIETRLRGDIPKEKMAAVASITVEDTKNGQKTTVRLHDKRAALVDLGKHFNLFREKIDVNVTTKNTIEVGLLETDERILMRQLLMAAKERKEQQEAEAKALEDQTRSMMGDVEDVEYSEIESGNDDD